MAQIGHNTEGAPKRYLISGGGTGGHIFPAISIANALRALQPDCEILFIGALGRMEMTRVADAGYQIIGVPIQGLERKHLIKNIRVFINLYKSIKQAKKIVRDFCPDVAIGVGGYVSGAALKAANMLGVNTLLQEQNSFAGVTNKLLAKKAAKICVAYSGMERFFPKDKILLTGNPVRQSLAEGVKNRHEAYAFFGLNPEKKTLLIIGGSLGAFTINQSVITHLKALTQAEIQIIWQTGKSYIDQARHAAEAFNCSNLVITDFVSRMDYAYAVADLVISRAGASSISELCLLGKPTILVPSPNVSEDHQTHNALALVNKQAAILVKDAEAEQELIPKALILIENATELQVLSENISSLAEHNSDIRIAQEVIALANL